MAVYFALNRLIGQRAVGEAWGDDYCALNCIVFCHKIGLAGWKKRKLKSETARVVNPILRFADLPRPFFLPRTLSPDIPFSC